jgi:flagellin
MSLAMQWAAKGQRILPAPDDLTGSRVHPRLGGNIRLAKQGKRNASDSISYLRVADTVLYEVTDQLTHAAGLVEQIRAGGNDDSSRSSITTELRKVLSTIHERFEKARFNGAAVFTSTRESVTVSGFSSICLNVGSIGSGVGSGPGLTTPDDADALGSAISTAIASARFLRASLDASMQQLASVSSLLGIQVENMAAACSEAQDANTAEAVTNLTKFQILNHSGTGAWVHTHLASRQILALLR